MLVTDLKIRSQEVVSQWQIIPPIELTPDKIRPLCRKLDRMSRIIRQLVLRKSDVKECQYRPC
jgi:hypothetical protein